MNNCNIESKKINNPKPGKIKQRKEKSGKEKLYLMGPP
jgi:hypothetical protein